MEPSYRNRSDVFAEEELSRTVIRIRALQRLILWNFLSGTLPLYLVTEFPKSGATWYSKMLSECLDVPFPKSLSQPTLNSVILRDTKLYSRSYKNLSVMFRDGRDIMVSAYYHFLFPNEVNVKYAIAERRKLLDFKDYDDIEENLPKFIEYMFETFPKTGWSTRFNWAEFADSWINKNVPKLKYEDLLDNPVEELKRMVFELTGQTIDSEKITKTVEKYSFRNITGRDRGNFSKNSFARKGIAGDWKNHFNSKSCKLFNQYAGKQLIELGYESDSSWI